MRKAAVRSIALSLPETIRRNDYWIEKYPHLVDSPPSGELDDLWTQSTENLSFFEQMTGPYLNDPFRGTQQRHVLQPGESIRSHELTAIKTAVELAELDLSDIQLVISTSMWPEQLGYGNGLWLINELDMNCGAWNIENAQCGGLTTLQTAASIIAAGFLEHIVIVSSGAYTQAVPEDNTVSWFMGDAATAAVISPSQDDSGMIAMSTHHARETIQDFQAGIIRNPNDTYKLSLELGPTHGEGVRKYWDKHITSVTDQVLEKAHLTKDDIDFYIFNTPTAWAAQASAQALNIPPEKTDSSYPYLGNVGPALTLANLHYSINHNKIHPHDLILIHSLGSVCSTGASIIQWGNTTTNPTHY